MRERAQNGLRGAFLAILEGDDVTGHGCAFTEVAGVPSPEIVVRSAVPYARMYLSIRSSELHQLDLVARHLWNLGAGYFIYDVSKSSFSFSCVGLIIMIRLMSAGSSRQRLNLAQLILFQRDSARIAS